MLFNVCCRFFFVVRRCGCLFVGCCLSFAVLVVALRCLLLVVCCLLWVVCRLLFAVGCELRLACGVLFV